MNLSDRLRLQAAAAEAAAGGDGVGRPGREDAAEVEAPEPTATAHPLASLVTARQAADPQADLKRRLRTALYGRLGARLYDASLTDAQLRDLVATSLEELLLAEGAPLTPDEVQRLHAEVVDDVLGFGPLEPFLDDDDVTEVMVNGTRPVYVERKGKLHETDVRFTEEAHLRRVIDRIVGAIGRRVDESSPMVDARLPDGSRVNAVIPPLSVDGPTLTIRKFSKERWGSDDLVGFGTMTASVAEFLASCVAGRLNVLVSGGTGTGKTTLLNVLSSFIPEDERIVTIEDAVELRLQQDHVVRLESRPANLEGRGKVEIRDLVRNALRMRPDRIIVGEVRGAEALDMLQAMNTGHDGSLCTVHANAPRDSLNRLETMVLMAGFDLPSRAIREQIASALDVIVQIARLRDGSRRVVKIAEVVGMEGSVITTQDIFDFDHAAGLDENGRHAGRLVPTGIRASVVDKLADNGIVVPVEVFQRAELTLVEAR
ncbi:MAG: CpaF family protein [Acidimicrobiia bacterium]